MDTAVWQAVNHGLSFLEFLFMTIAEEFVMSRRDKGPGMHSSMCVCVCVCVCVWVHAFCACYVVCVVDAYLFVC